MPGVLAFTQHTECYFRPMAERFAHPTEHTLEMSFIMSDQHAADHGGKVPPARDGDRTGRCGHS